VVGVELPKYYLAMWLECELSNPDLASLDGGTWDYPSLIQPDGVVEGRIITYLILI
jgi:hypothetical protein